MTGLELSAPLELSDDIIRKATEKGPVIVAHSVMSTQTNRVFHESKKVKARFGDAVTLIGGGPHASARPGELLDAGFDHVVIGEGEKLITDLLWYLMNDKDPRGIDGIVSEKRDSYPKPKVLPGVNLDGYPPFALDMNVLGPIEVTRGCPFACKFCCTPFLTGRGVRHRSEDSVVKWLSRAAQQRGFRRTWFLSPNAFSYGGRGREMNLDRLENLLRGATSVEGLEEVFFGAFPSEVRPEFVSKEALNLLRSYVANETLQIGLQSASDSVLDSVNRHHTVKEGLDAIRMSFDYGFTPHVDMMFGLPGETDEELKASIEMCEELARMGAMVHGHVFMPLPGSAFENRPPGILDPESRSTLGELSRKGVLTGSWSTQETMAAELASGWE